VICVTVATATAKGATMSDQLFEQLPINAALTGEVQVLGSRRRKLQREFILNGQISDKLLA